MVYIISIKIEGITMQNDNVAERNLRGKIAGIVGIIVNLMLAGAKMAVGFIFGVISVLADGLNNLTDCGSSVISTLSFKLSAKPADEEHPFGHERLEYVFSLAVVFIILLVAFETAKESINKIISPVATEFSIIIIAVLAVSILVKCGLFIYYNRTAKAIGSDILHASAIDSLTDCISTTVVLITVILGEVASLNVDGYAGVLVSLFIAYSAFGVLKEIVSKLIGQAPEADLVKDIKAKILAYPGVLGVHDLSVYCYGPNKYFASVHVEVDASIDVLISHELVDAIEKDFMETTGIVLTGHLDPIVIDDERVNLAREEIDKKVKELDERFTLHDFRMVFGEKRTNVLFDVAVPYDAFKNKEEIKEKVELLVKEVDEKYVAVITVEPAI